MKAYVITCVSHYTVEQKFYLEDISKLCIDAHLKINLRWSTNKYNAKCFYNLDQVSFFLKEIEKKLSEKKSIVQEIGLHNIDDLKIQKIHIVIEEI